MIDEALRAAVAEVLGLEGGQVTMDLGVGRHPRWDSLGQLKVMLNVEEFCAVRFKTEEISSLDTVAKIAQALEARRVK